MDTRGWERAKELFHEAVRRPLAEREELLAGAPSEVREEVLALLAAHEEAGPPKTSGSVEGEGPGTVIDRYKILQEIGEGGFGVVYMAEQVEPVQRKVALKIIKLGMDTKQVVARFEAERQALALMDHPNIAKVLDGGATKQGRPYFVMELVKGIPITAYCDQAGLTTGERLDLFTSVCHAIQHAHQKGIIHRDLKPSNVLVTLHEGKPVPKVIDFGIAKATDRRLTEKTLFTEYRQIIGTPEYMAPEQAEMTSLDVDTRADIYSLGVLLYELLTGTKPFDLKSLLEKGYGEVLRTIREVDPPRPSTRLSTLGDELPTIAKQRHTQPKLLGRLIRGDLDWIVMKALEKDRSRRYDTATALADDIGRALLDEPVLAGPPTRAYRLRKYLKRHRVGVATAAAILVALVGGLIVSYTAMQEARRQTDLARAAETEAASQRDAATLARTEEAEQRLRAENGEAEAKREAKRASTALGLITRALRSADPNQTKNPNYTVRELLDDVAADLGDEVEEDPGLEATLRGTIGKAYLGLGLTHAAEPHLARTLALRREHLGDDHPATVITLSNWGWALYKAGEYQEAAEVAREVHEAMKRLHGPDAPETIGAQGTLASRLIPLSRYEEAEQLLREAAALADGRPDLPRTSALRLAHVLTLVLNSRGANKEAERVLRSAIARVTESEAELGPLEGPLLPLARSLLVEILVKRGQYREARALCQEGLAWYRSRLGEEHVNTVYAKSNLAHVDWAEGKWDDAARRYEAVVSELRRQGVKNVFLWRILNDYALVLHSRGDLASALPLSEEAVQGVREVVGDGHPSTGSVVSTLAAIHADLGHLARAEELQRQALSSHERSAGKESQGYVAALNNLVAFLMQGGRYREAVEPAEEALELSRRVHGEEHPVTARVLANLSRLRSELGEPQEALELLQRGIGIIQKTQPDHPDLAIGLNNLGDLYRRVGRREEAEEALLESLRLTRLRLGPRHANTIGILQNLGLVLADGGRDAEARARFIEALEVAREVRGPDSPAPMAVFLNLGEFEEARASYAEAEKHQREVLRLADLHPRQQRGVVASAHHLLGRLLRRRGQIAECEHHLRKAIEIATEMYGPMGVPTIHAKSELADLTRAQGNPERAIQELEPLLSHVREHTPRSALSWVLLRNLALALRDLDRREEAVEAMEGVVAAVQSARPGSTDEMIAVGDLGDLLQRYGRNSEAASRYAKAVALARKLALESTPRTAVWQWRLGGSLVAEGEHERAIGPLRASLVVFRETLPAGHGYTASALATLGWALVESGRHEESEAPLREALEMRQEGIPDHFLTWNTMSLLGAALAGQAKYEEAEPLLLEGYEKFVPPDTPVWKERKEKARLRLVALYEAWGKPDEAATWRAARTPGEGD